MLLNLCSLKLKTYKVMKYEKFRKLLLQYPWLVDVVDPFGYLRHNPKTCSLENKITLRLCSHIRNDLQYVAFRPWCTLPDPVSSTVGSYETTLTLEHAVRCDPYYGGTRGYQYYVEWEIIWKIGDRQCQPSSHRDGFTLSESMIEIQMEYKKGYFGEGELRFTHIVKRITEASSQGGPEKMSIEIFTIPKECSTGFDYGSELTVPPTNLCERDLLDWRRKLCEYLKAS